MKKAEEDSAGLGCGFISSKANNHLLTFLPICQGANLFFFFTPDFVIVTHAKDNACTG